jgi:hypothetical protein
MIAKCANPACSARFLYLHTGKLFRFERDARADEGPLLGFDPSVRKRPGGVEFFWLCETCAAVMTLVYTPSIGVTTRWLRPELKAS